MGRTNARSSTSAASGSGSIPAQGALRTRRAALFPYRGEERHARAFRCGLRNFQDCRQENREAYRHAGAGYLSAACLQLWTRVDGKKNERTVFALPKFTIPDGKKLVVEMYEKQGGRHQSFEVENEDLVRAETVNELKVR